MNRKMRAALVTCLTAGILAGCANPPQETLVQAKRAAAAQADEGAARDAAQTDGAIAGSAVQADGAIAGSAAQADRAARDAVQADGAVAGNAAQADGRSLRERLGAPRTYRSTAEDGDGKLKIETDAAVELPDVSAIPLVSVKPHVCTQKELAALTDALFGDAKWYDARELVTGACDARALKEQSGPFDFREEPVDPWMPQRGTVEKAYAFVETGEGSSYRCDLTREKNGGVSLWAKRTDGAQTLPNAALCQWFGRHSMQSLYPWVPDEAAHEKAAGITGAQAKTIADDAAARLGFTDMQVAASEPVIEVLCAKSGAPTSRDMGACGYLFHYTRSISGVPVTYTMIPGGSLANAGEGAVSWAYETLDICVGRDGVEEIRLENRYDITAVLADGGKLLPFSEIMAVYERMMKLQESEVFVDRRAGDGDFGAPPQTRVYRVSKITLGYARIYDPYAMDEGGVLVPVWDFFGEYDEVGADGKTKTVSDENRSFLTINAMDATLVDRWLGC